ncbi:MAG: small multi-drug export protein [Clostridia bacterium]|nr:small multi-drug export protein [Clostridia bacterium]
MAEHLTRTFVDSMDGKLAADLIVFLISMLPVLELRGGLIAAKLLELPFWPAFTVCVVGNLLPVPFLLLFIRRIFALLKRFHKVEALIEKVEARSVRKARRVVKYRLWGLLLLVAIPLPGTGAWTGALAAAFLDIRMKHALPVIAAGVVIAGVITAALSYGLPELIK